MSHTSSSGYSTFSVYQTTSSSGYHPPPANHWTFTDYSVSQQAMTSVEHSVPFSDPTSLPELGSEPEAYLAPPSQCSTPSALPPGQFFAPLASAYEPRRDHFINPCSVPTASRVTIERNSSLFLADEMTLPSTSFSWHNTTFDNIDLSTSTYSSSSIYEHLVRGAPLASQNNILEDEDHSISRCEQECQFCCIPSSVAVAAPSGEQAIPTDSFPDCIVPQIIYQPKWKGDKERYVSKVKLQPPIVFLARESPEQGIPVLHLLSKHPVRIVGGNKPAFTACGPSIEIRVNWPGYQPLHKRVPTKDDTWKRAMITKQKLAKVVARYIVQCMENISKQEIHVGPDPQWRVGPSHIRAGDITLVSLHHVSQGSWQPHLRLHRIIEDNVTGLSLNTGGRYGRLAAAEEMNDGENAPKPRLTMVAYS